MIGSLRGTVLARTGTELTIEVAGVGYRCVPSPGVATSAGEIGAAAFVWIHHHLREDAQTLYAFGSEEERAFFEALLGAHGVGPALALSILGVLSPAQLAAAVSSDDLAALCLVPGVGKKTASRLLLELKSRLDPASLQRADAVPAVSAARDTSATSARADVRAALSELGYGADEIARTVSSLPEGEDSGELLRAALAHLAGG